jgi:hypothetical protein
VDEILSKRVVFCNKLESKPKPYRFCSKKIWGDGIAILYRSTWFLFSLEGVCAVPISNAILWTHFVTPRGDQTQYDQTKRISYYKKEKSEQSEYNSDLVGL